MGGLQRRDQLCSPPLAVRSGRPGSSADRLGAHRLDELLDAAARRGDEGGEALERLEERPG